MLLSKTKLILLGLSPLFLFLAIFGYVSIEFFFYGEAGHEIANERFHELEQVKLLIEKYGNPEYPYVDLVDDPEVEIRFYNGSSYLRYYASFNSPILDLRFQTLECNENEL